VPTCQFNTREVGSLRHQSFEELWRGTPIEEQRGWVRRCPGCWAECEVLPNAVYTGGLARELVAPPPGGGGRRRAAPERPSRRPLPVLEAGGAE
jgi:hypothetical protein